MHLENTVSIIISGPLPLTVTDGCMRSNQMVIATPLISVNLGTRCSELMYMGFKCVLVGVMHDTQPNLTAFPSNGANNWGTVVFIGAMPFSFVSTSPGWV